MAKSTALFLLCDLFIIFSQIIAIAIANSELSFSRKLSPSSLGLKKEKLTHLHFYFHDIVSGKNVTAVRVAQANTTATSPVFFGATAIIDDPLTSTPELNSTVVGRAQGVYALASESEAALLMVMNLAFVEGKYNGSTLAVLGRNRVFSAVREMPVLGGSGLFRFARGYALARTHEFDLKTGNACVEYDVYVLHY